MNPAMSPRLKISKSRIPVRVQKTTPSIVNDSERKIPDKPLFRAPLSTSAKGTKFGNFKQQLNSKVVKPDKTTGKYEGIRTLKYGGNRQSSITNNSKVCSDINKKAKSSQLKSSGKVEISKKKVINQSSSTKESILKSKDTVSKGQIIKDTSKKKISTLKIIAKTTKSETEAKTIKPGVKSGDSSDKLKSSRCVSEKKNEASLKPSRLAAQKDIKFEVNENSRKMILREQAPSPGFGNKMSGFGFSWKASHRSSIYQPMEMVADPYKEAMRALACFSAKRNQENCNQEKAVKLLSPLKNRNSYYTPSADSKKEILKKLKQEENCSKPTPSSFLSEKENNVSSKPSILAAQKDIKFEVNENSRKMILGEQAPSPGIGNKMSGFRLSSRPSQRPSIYQPMEMAADPYKEAMRALACYSEKRKQEKFNLEKASKLLSQDRNSFYTPCADSKEKVVDSLRKLTLKQEQQKSTKKVTFNLNVIECAPKNDSDAEAELFQEGKLSQIDEKSEENTPSSPGIKKAAAPPALQDNANVNLADFEKSDLNHQNDKNVAVTNDGKCENFAKSMLSSTATTIKHEELPVVQYKETTSQHYERVNTPPLFANLCLKNVSITNEIATKSGRTRNKTIHTPRPISFYSRSKLQESCSPEFVVNGSSGTFLKEAPICTPLVLKSMAKNTELSPDVEDTLSPVRLKLNFTEKETPRVKISEFHPSHNRKQIKTVQSQLDELADQECGRCLSNGSIPVVCGRYITNPVAQTLSEGDEMHFIPIKL